MCYALFPSPASPPDPVNIVLDGEGEGEVDNHFDVRDVKAPGGNICSNQQIRCAALELFQGVRALPLGLVAVD